MNIKTYFWLRRSLFCFCLVAALPVPLVGAADPAQTQPKPPVAGTAAVSHQEYVLEIVNGVFFHNGQRTDAFVGTAVDVLRELYPNFNIAISPDVAQIRILDLKLRSTSIEEALQALRIATGNRFAWRKGWNATDPIDPSTGLPQPVAKTESTLYTLEPDPNVIEQSQRRVEVFNLSNYLERAGKREPKEVEESLNQIKKIILDTLDHLWQGRLTPPDFQFHPGASLLIAIGSPEAIDVTAKVVQALNAPAPPRAPAPTH